MTATGKGVCYTPFPRGDMPPRAGPQWAAPGLVRGKRGQEPSSWFPHEGMDEAGSADLGLSSLNNFSKLWSVRCYLPPGSGVVRAGEQCPEYESPIQKVVSVWLWTGLGMKCVPKGESSSISRNCLAWGRGGVGEVSPESARSRCQSFKNTEIKKA